jgi:hypothetical protein
MAHKGRPPVLNEIKKSEILAILSVGCSRRVAAAYVGCARRTIHNTATRDKDFAGKLRRADHHAEINCLRNIQQAAKKEQYWRAAAWVLEHRNPTDFGPRHPGAVTADQIALVLSDLADTIVSEVPVAEQRERILERIASLTKNIKQE